MFGMNIEITLYGYDHTVTGSHGLDENVESM